MKKLFSPKLLRLLSLLGLLSLLFSTTSFAVRVEIPEGGRESDIIVNPSETQVNGEEQDIFKLIQIINKYLRFSIGLVCMVGLVIGGFKLMASGGDEDANKKASTILMGSLIGILIAVFSYALVRLIVNLF